MRVEVLGCSGGKTQSASLPSFLIDGRILLDCGSVCSALSLERQLNLKAILISHAHFDHICDLPFLVDNFSIASKQIKVYSSEKTIEILKENVFNGRIWPDFTKIPSSEFSVLEFVKVDDGKILRIDSYVIEFFHVIHTEGSIGFIVSDGQSSFAYTADTFKTNGLWDFLKEKGVKSVITECSFPAERKELAVLSKHLSVPDFLNELSKMNGIENVYVFHLKPHYRELIDRELSKHNVILLKDGDILEV